MVGVRAGRVCLGALLLGLMGCSEPVATSDTTTLNSLTFASVPGDDAPELAHLGPHRVGVRTLQFAYDGAPDVSVAGHLGATPTWTRQLSVDVLYPADVGDGTEPDAVYTGTYHTGFAEIEGLPTGFQIKGWAVRDAPPVLGQRFPLVIVSHGLLNTPGVLSGVTENLASKGYVVAVIDHRDAQDDPDTPVHLFARVLLNRVLDQRRVLREMLALAGTDGDVVGQLIDAESIGLMGFSMGGYGVIGHAGAGFDPDGSALGIVPTDAIAEQTENSPSFVGLDRTHIDAVVAFAPWGGKAGDVWTDTALSNVESPLLILAGSQDDVSDFELGIQRIFDKTINADRYMLVFQNAQHNLVQVAAPASAHLDVRSWMTFEDATWRRDRLLSVGTHFATAFFDWKLKGIATRRHYLDLPTVASNDGSWEQGFLADESDRFADGSAGSENYWTGFKPRQAIGLEMHYQEGGARVRSDD